MRQHFLGNPLRSAGIVGLLVAAALVACGSNGGGSSASSEAASSIAATSSSSLAVSAPTSSLNLQSVSVEVPSGLDSAPFNQARTLNVPEGFVIRVIARVDGARFLAVTPDGGLLVSQPNAGKLTLLRRDGNTWRASDFAAGLRMPHDMVFYRSGDATWLYVSEAHQVSRFAWTDGMTKAGAAQVVIANLPNASTPGIGSYGHQLKNIALSTDGKLFVAIASTCNVCESDAKADPVRGSIYVYDADGRNGRLYARGLRNAEGLDILPGTGQLWAAVNNRDQIPFPYHGDFDGDGRDDYGRVMSRFVDDNPPDPFTSVREGGDYGWPYCNAGPRSADRFQSLPLERDIDTNADGNQRDCAALDRASLSLPAHSAPLGMSFLQGSSLPAPWKNGAAIALHGCWNCTRLNGHSVVFVPFDGSKPGHEVDMITGWMTDASARSRWGRPVDVVPSLTGSLYVSDDFSDTVYELYRK
ncbi:sorbosone dehydrogenase family protein [Uliginosibacterium sp. sgz301328]|uniref:PQQ-dependent sugar dehydrogenase n=1 Tax=Uliginosibacterium sp. sgz301328 TaxID=3243764 RepID=UPI00359E811B